jgi:hypothetical protein
VGLGNRGLSTLIRVGRCLIVWTAFTLALGAAWWLLRARAWQAWSDRQSVATLDRALTDASAGILLACLGWAWLAGTVTVAEALVVVTTAGRQATTERGEGARLRPWRLPAGVRRLVLAGCGVALAAGLAQPALAADLPAPHARGPSVLSGLPLPERAVAPTGSTRQAGARTVVVRPGDCLWSIAARELPPGASARAIAERWRAIYAVNRRLIGADPDRLVAGQRLRVPPAPVSSDQRKDPS